MRGRGRPPYKSGLRVRLLGAGYTVRVQTTSVWRISRTGYNRRSLYNQTAVLQRERPF